VTSPHGHPASIRVHVLGIVLLGAILPLALIGLWLTRSGVRSGEALLDEQLATSLVNVEHAITTRWVYRRSDLLLLADNENARRALASGVVTSGDSGYFARVGSSVAHGIAAFVYRDRAGRELYTSAPRSLSLLEAQASRVVRDTSGTAPRLTLHQSLPVRAGDGIVGSVDAEVYLDAVVPTDSARLLVPGSALAVRDRARAAVLIPLVGAADFPDGHGIAVNGAPWMVRIDSLADPALDLAVGAPIAPYVTPFKRAGRIGLVALSAVALLALLLSGFLTARLARSTEALVEAAKAVADGDLTRQAEPTGPREFHRLAGSFNTMTESLRGLVSELSQRRALAAVGEFAASLAHEVRNALTSVQIDLERVDERTEDAKNRGLVARALVHVRRLDAAVTGSLRVARSGNVTAQSVNLNDILREAIRVAEPSYTSSSVRLTTDQCDPESTVRGDPDALHQLFLNLLLNAQQALPPGGETTVSARPAGDRVVVSIADSGSGMTSEQVAHAFDPYYTTRPKGTGLGLPIARRIAVAHGGDLTLCSTPGTGTTVEVSLPVAS
jgi:signal transduction histidine kinase